MIEHFLDLEGIRRTIVQYSQLLDDQRFDAWGALFTEDAVFASIPGGHLPGGGAAATFAGRTAIVEAIAGVQKHLSAQHAILHFGGPPLIDLDGATARAWWDFQVLYLKPSGTETAHAGRYYADLVKQEGRWLFRRRVSVRAGHALPDDVSPPPSQ